MTYYRKKFSFLILLIISSLTLALPLMAAEQNNHISDLTASNLNPGGDDDWDDEAWSDDEWNDEETSPVEINHTLWAGAGGFTNDQDFIQDDHSLLETRYRLDVSGYFKDIYAALKSEIIADDVSGEIDLENREAYLSFSPHSNIDIRAGRQVLTWGTGDLLFLNDLFPKDWQSFFSGREMEYLKIPSDALKISTFSKFVNMDIVWSPQYEADNYLSGERFSFFNPLLGHTFAAPPKINPEFPGSNLKDSETALRLYRTIEANEIAFYAYHGFNKQPRAFNPLNGQSFFPQWQAYGASVRSPLGGGIANVELAWHRSMEDQEGSNGYIPNSEIRFLIGFEKEVISKLNLGLQYYLEHIQDHDSLIINSLTPQFEPEENRSVITLRLNYRALQDKLSASFFSYYSPTDEDYYLIPSLTYRMNDLLSINGGANIFNGKKNYTFFGQLEENSNIFTRIKLSF